MKLIHLSDLHLGKRVNEFSMLEDQQHILTEILGIIDREEPQAVLIAGDVYDKAVPPAEAVSLLDRFLVSLARRQLQVFIISGNHDSPERLAFGGTLLAHSGIHLSPVYSGQVTPVTLTDRHGPVHFYLLPFVKPAHVRRCFPEGNIASYTDALAAAVAAMEVDTGARNVLVTHQFVTGAARCDSEELSVGGSDNVDAAVFDPFDYVALGHIHKASGLQKAGETWYSWPGCPEGRGFDEAGEKTVSILELGDGDCKLETRTIAQRRYELMKVDVTGSDALLAVHTQLPDETVKDIYRIILTGETEQSPDLRQLYSALSEMFFQLQLRDETRLRRSVWERAGDDTLRGLFLEKLKKRYDEAKTDEQRIVIEQAARWGLAALDNGEEVARHEDQ